jgi:hypothetical protein
MSSTTSDPVLVDGLVSEIERYLATVDFFRSQGCEPQWSTEAATHAQTASVDHVARPAA